MMRGGSFLCNARFLTAAAGSSILPSVLAVGKRGITWGVVKEIRNCSKPSGASKALLKHIARLKRRLPGSPVQPGQKPLRVTEISRGRARGWIWMILPSESRPPPDWVPSLMSVLQWLEMGTRGVAPSGVRLSRSGDRLCWYLASHFC
jgi:hypothetical protein